MHAAAGPPRRAVDLALRAAANIHRVPLLTRKASDFALVADIVDARSPE